MSDSAGAPTDGPPGRSGDEARVLLLVDRDENRRLLSEWLAARHEVVDPRSDGADRPVDLCVVDPVALGRHADRLRRRKESAHPVVLPVLLLVPGDAGTDWHRDEAVRELVDEVIATPIRQAELRTRIRGLLERRALSAERARSETRFRTLFQTVPDPVVVLDADGRVQNANEAFCELAVVDASKLYGERLDDLAMFPRDLVERLLAPLEDPDWCPGAPYTVAHTTSAGETRFSSVNTAVLTEEGERTGTINVLRDVTERTRNRRELERQYERLDEFARVLAHEIRNPLNLAEGYLDMAREAGDDDHFARVERAHRRMEGMVDELLRLVRRGDNVSDFEPVPLADAAEVAWAGIDAAGAHLRVVRDDTLIVDRDRLVDLLAGLFANAVDHAGPDVSVRVGMTDDGNGFYVEDDGPGVPPEERDRVFDPGYSTADGGTGFGLTVAKQIAEAHGWALDLADAESGGARFEITGVTATVGRGGVGR